MSGEGLGGRRGVLGRGREGGWIGVEEGRDRFEARGITGLGTQWVVEREVWDSWGGWGVLGHSRD